MSHMYFITADDTPTGAKLADVQLSNTSHYDWMTKAGLTRQMRNTVTGETETWLFHTTIHDAEPLFVYSYEFVAYVDSAAEETDDADHIRLLYEFIDKIENFEGLNGREYKVWLY